MTVVARRVSATVTDCSLSPQRVPWFLYDLPGGLHRPGRQRAERRVRSCRGMPAEFETLRRVLVPARLSLSSPHRCWLESGWLLQATLAKYLFHNPGSSPEVGCVFHRYGCSLGYCRNADARWSNTPARSEIWRSRSLAKAVANSARCANLSPYYCVALVHRYHTAGLKKARLRRGASDATNTKSSQSR